MIDPERIKKVLDERIPASAFEPDPAPSPDLGSNLIEPTLDMIEEVIRLHLLDKKSVKEIKKSVKSSGGKKLSFGQIKQILKAADARKVSAEV